MSTLKKYLSLVKFSHTIFAMPFAFIGFFLAMVKLSPPWNLYEPIGWSQRLHLKMTWNLFNTFILVIICMVTARSAAMAFNRYLDSHFDAQNPRTAIREIPAGVISKENALRFVHGFPHIGNQLL